MSLVGYSSDESVEEGTEGGTGGLNLEYGNSSEEEEEGKKKEKKGKTHKKKKKKGKDSSSKKRKRKASSEGASGEGKAEAASGLPLLPSVKELLASKQQSVPEFLQQKISEDRVSSTTILAPL